MELLRDIWRYAVGRHTLPVLAALVLMAVLAIGPVAFMLAARPDPQRADAIVPALPMSPIGAATSPASKPAVTTAPAGAPPSAGSALIKALQVGLTRAECYDGPVNGYWTSKSKEAMARFVNVLNARLPVNQPDPVLLSLVETNPKASCNPARTAPQQSVSAAEALGFSASSRQSETREPAAAPPRAEPPAAPPSSQQASGSISSLASAAAPVAAGVAAAAVAAGSSAAQDRPFGLPATGSQTTAAAPANGKSGASSSDDDDDDDEAKPAQKARSKATRSASSGSERRYRPRRQQTAFDGVSRQMNRNFRSLSRSLSGLFN